MITIEFWGPSNKSYGPILEKKTEQRKVPLKQAYALAKTEEYETSYGFIKIFINGKWVPNYHLIRQYEQTHPRKRNLKIYVEFPGNSFVLVDDDTKEDVFRGTKWEVEKYLDEHGYFQDDESKFSI